MVNKALMIATLAHAHQKDKGGAPYITHPVRMALSLKSETLRTIALLHDVVEDTSITLQDLTESFPPEIVNAIDALTHRSGEKYDDYLNRVNANPLAVEVKIADLKDNLLLEREYPGRRTEQYKAALEFLTMI